MNPFTKIEREIKRGLNNLSDEVRGGIERVGQQTKGELESAVILLKHEVEELSDKAIDELEDKVKEALEAIFAEITKEGFRKAVSVLRKAEQLGETALEDAAFELNLSLVSLSWSNIGGRVGSIREKIEGFVNSPPKLSRSYILDIVKVLAPDQISLSIDVKLAALVVTSDDLAAGFKFSVSLPAFLDASDEFLDAVGL